MIDFCLNFSWCIWTILCTTEVLQERSGQKCFRLEPSFKCMCYCIKLGHIKQHCWFTYSVWKFLGKGYHTVTNFFLWFRLPIKRTCWTSLLMRVWYRFICLCFGIYRWTKGTGSRKCDISWNFNCSYFASV